MFKKIASIALAAALVGSTAVIAASAADAEEAVAAAEDSAVAAADDSAVGAEEESDATGASGKIYFEVPSTWTNFKAATFYLYQHGDGGGEIEQSQAHGPLSAFCMHERHFLETHIHP